MKSNLTLSEELTWRGFVHQTTFKDIKDLDKEKRTFYHGFDASADSQTIGNLAAMMFDAVFMRHGYKAIILAGGATSLVGDPGGKDKERDIQAEDRIKFNVEQAEKELRRIHEGKDFRLVNNIDWTKDLRLLEFLRTIGKNFGVGDLIKKDFIATRLGEGTAGISYAEFTYTLLQGMDYLHLFDEHGATLQLGGSDQWGNCISGVDLIRKVRGEEVHVISHPLVVNSSTGKKFGKSEDGAVWLNPEKTSVYKFYQFWLNIDDEGVAEYIKIYTEVEQDRFDDLMAEFEKDKSSRSAQKFLAFECTKIVHGEEAAKRAKKITEVLFDGRNVAELSEAEFIELAEELPNSKEEDLVSFVVETGLAKSKGAARRLIEQGAVQINGNKATVESKFSTDSLVKKGKNSFAVKLK